MDKSDKKLINEIKLILNEAPKSMQVESLIFGEENEPMSEIDRMPEKPDFSEREETPYESEEDEKIAQNVSPLDAEIKPIIDKIRVLALQGIAKLANNPTSESYQLLKKVWGMIDKAAETANKNGKED